MKFATLLIASVCLLVSACASNQSQSEDQRKAALRADFDRANPGFASTYNTTPTPMANTQRGQVDSNAVMKGLLLMEAARPKFQPAPMPPMMNPTIRCVTRPSIGAMQTTCN